MAVKKKARSGATRKKARTARKTAARKAVKKTAKKASRKTARKAAKKKAPARKAAARRPAKAAAVRSRKQTPARKKKQVMGEGDYEASRAFLKDQADFVRQNKAGIPAMGREAEAALEGPEGDALREAEAAGQARSRDTF